MSCIISKLVGVFLFLQKSQSKRIELIVLHFTEYSSVNLNTVFVLCAGVKDSSPGCDPPAALFSWRASPERTHQDSGRH